MQTYQSMQPTWFMLVKLNQYKLLVVLFYLYLIPHHWHESLPIKCLSLYKYIPAYYWTLACTGITMHLHAGEDLYLPQYGPPSISYLHSLLTQLQSCIDRRE